jgi:hypothetical protein
MWPNDEGITDLDLIVCRIYFSTYDQAICLAFHNGDIVVVHLDSSEEKVDMSIRKIFFQNDTYNSSRIYRLKLLDQLNLRSNAWNGVRMKN